MPIQHKLFFKLSAPMALTVSRMACAPLVYLLFYLVRHHADTIAMQLLLIGAVAVLIVYSEISDWLDGAVARKRGQITDAGKVLDPLADVMVHGTLLLCLGQLALVPHWCVAVFVYRECGMVALRYVSIFQHRTIAASIFGKIKSVLFAVGISSMVALMLLQLILRLSGLTSDSIVSTGSSGDTIESGANTIATMVVQGMPRLYWIAWSVIVAAVVCSILSFVNYLMRFVRSNRQNS